MLLVNGHRRESATTGALAGRDQSDPAFPVLLENRAATEEFLRRPEQGHAAASTQHRARGL